MLISKEPGVKPVMIGENTWPPSDVEILPVYIKYLSVHLSIVHYTPNIHPVLFFSPLLVTGGVFTSRNRLLHSIILLIKNKYEPH